MIIFAAGYNLKRKRFFMHFNYIFLFGVIGTFCGFIVYAFLHILMFKMFSFEKYDLLTGEYEPFEMLLVENLLISAMLSSSDAIAAVSIVNFDE